MVLRDSTRLFKGLTMKKTLVFLILAALASSLAAAKGDSTTGTKAIQAIAEATNPDTKATQTIAKSANSKVTKVLAESKATNPQASEFLASAQALKATNSATHTLVKATNQGAKATQTLPSAANPEKIVAMAQAPTKISSTEISNPTATNAATAKPTNADKLAANSTATNPDKIVAMAQAPTKISNTKISNAKATKTKVSKVTRKATRKPSGQAATAPKATTSKKATRNATAQKAAAPKKATRKTAAKATTQASTKKVAAKKSTKKIIKKANKKQAPTAVAQKERGKEQQLGLMPSTLDSTNHSVYYADADAIGGARDTESALRYIPFVTIVNTAGFGQQFDLRSQGRLSANGVKLHINGIAANPLDSYYGFMPINTILPNLIQEIKVYPGSGAVLYGSGTRGGVIDIITSKRQNPYFAVGAGYVNTSGGDSSYFAHAQASEKFGNLHLNAGLGYSQKGGPRESDNTKSLQAVLGLDFALNLGTSIFADADFYTGKTTTTPYNSFWDIATTEQNFAIAQAGGFGNDYKLINDDGVKAYLTLTTPPTDPKNKGGADDGDGEIESSQTRLNASLGFKNELFRGFEWEIKGIFAMDNRKYDTYTARLPFYAYQNRYFVGIGASSNIADQSGSSFKETKFGGKFKLDWQHYNGELIFGIDSIVEKSKRTALQYLIAADLNNRTSTDMNYSGITVDINNELDLFKFTNAAYLLERYDFSKYFSLSAGVRYEMVKYSTTSNDYVFARLSNINAAGVELSAKHQTQNPQVPEHKAEKNVGNLIFEVTPVIRYSDTGALYARYERGAINVPPYALSQRLGKIELASTNTLTETTAFNHNFSYVESNLDDESYDTFELGWKEFIGGDRVYVFDGLYFAANAFYTSSKNEFYFEGDPYAGLSYGTYDKSRRLGGEVALEQYLLNGILGFNESFTYVKAQFQDPATNEWKQIPYTYDYKATLGANINLAGFIEVAHINLNLWIQNSIYGGQKVSYSKYTNITGGQSVTATYGFVTEDAKLDPYVLSDVGVSIGFNKNAAVLTVGVKNVFDTFYYDYYNHDISAPIGEYRYLIGQGRTVFVEGSWKY